MKGLGRRLSLKGIVAFAASMSTCVALSAQVAQEKHLPLDGWIDDGSVHLTWRSVTQSRGDVVEVSRRPYGEVGGETWQPIEVEFKNGFLASDDTTQIGQAYEYRVLRRTADQQIKDVGYWLTGREVPVEPARGIAHVIVEQSIAEPIDAYLDRFVRDLTGDGWQVTRSNMPRHNPGSPQDNLVAIAAIKAKLKAAYTAAPNTRHAVILVGHVPFALSGSSAPDGHGTRPLATDLIYGDVDGRWRLSSNGNLADNALPSDAIEMQVGRIDFAPISAGDRGVEVHLLQSYFDKNHNWRHARLGDLREAYGKGPGLIGEINDLRNIVGPTEITEGGHHDVGETQPWLWGVDFGDGAGHIYAEQYANKAVFAINFGSHKQRIETPRNAMTGLLAQPWYPLAVGWGARPAWRLNHMALGGSIGDVHMRTVNNGRAAEPYFESMDYFPTGLYLWRNPIWVNLLGDPTLRAFPLAPPTSFTAMTRDDGVYLSWSRSSDRDVLGYLVYKQQIDGTFDLISGPEPLGEVDFLDRSPTSNAVYMIRAFGRKEVYAGSFKTLSQGTFAQVDQTPLIAPNLEVVGTTTAPTRLDIQQDGKTVGFIHEPPEGELSFQDGAWFYKGAANAVGTIPIRYFVSDAVTSAEGTLTITLRD